MSEWQRRAAASLRDQLSLMGQRDVPSNRDGFDEEFDALRALDQRVRANHDEFYTACLGSNMSKNRYREILPNEGTRVQLDPINARGDGDYINANYIDGRRLFGVPFVYIATQAPLRSTIGDFWRMVFENNTVFIVMLCAEIENGKAKCERYWPDGLGGVLSVGPLTLTLISENHRHDSIFRTINLRTADGREREIFHMQYVRWPDQGIPQTSAPLMEIIHSLGRSNASVRTPIVVHCSGGVGRTGVFITLHIALALFQMEQPISIPKLVQYLKFCRSGMVQRKDQYLFTYYAVLREMEKMIWALESTRNSDGAFLNPNPGVNLDPGSSNHDASPRRRPQQYLPQHPAQSRVAVPRSSFGGPELEGLPPTTQRANTNDFGPSLTSGTFDRSSSVSSAAIPAYPQQQSSNQNGGMNDVEAALRNMQAKTQSFRQTPSQVRSSGMSKYSAQTDASSFSIRPLSTEARVPAPINRDSDRLAAVTGRLPLDGARDPFFATQRPSAAPAPADLTLLSPIQPSVPQEDITALKKPASGVEVRQIRRDNDLLPPDSQASNQTASQAFKTENYFFSSTVANPGYAQQQRDPTASTTKVADERPSDLETASRNFNSSLFGKTPTVNGGAKNDLSLL